jgi:hypothetical protein
MKLRASFKQPMTPGGTVASSLLRETTSLYSRTSQLLTELIYGTATGFLEYRAYYQLVRTVAKIRRGSGKPAASVPSTYHSDTTGIKLDAETRRSFTSEPSTIECFRN